MSKLTSTGQSAVVQPFVGTVTLIPSLVDGRFEGLVYKAERVALRSPQGGVREHLWFRPDPRLHNHPWETISCKVVHGFYRAIEYWPDSDGGYRVREITLNAGDPEHVVPRGVYHKVVEVQAGAFSVMTFGPVVGNPQNWGHLVENSDGTFSHEPPQTDPEFLNALRHLNPHLRPEGWEDPFTHFPVFTLDDLLRQLNENLAA